MLTFLVENYLDGSNLSLSEGTVNAQFPLNNIKNSTTVKKFRTTTNTCKIVVDLLQTRNIDSLAIHGDSTTTLGLTSCGVRFSLTLDFSGYTQEMITLNAQYNMGYLLKPSPVSYRYVEFEFEGNGDYVEVSNIYIGLREDLTINNISTSSFQYGFDDNSDVSKNEYGQRFINVKNRLKNISGAINTCNREEQEQLEDIFDYHGTTLPFWIIVDKESGSMADGEYKLTMYGYLTEMPDWKAVNGLHWDTSIKMQQVI